MSVSAVELRSVVVIILLIWWFVSLVSSRIGLNVMLIRLFLKVCSVWVFIRCFVLGLVFDGSRRNLMERELGCFW